MPQSNVATQLKTGETLFEVYLYDGWIPMSAKSPRGAISHVLRKQVIEPNDLVNGSGKARAAELRESDQVKVRIAGQIKPIEF